MQLTAKQADGLREYARLAREGAKLRPQARGNYFKPNEEGGIVCSCFLGAVIEAHARETDKSALSTSQILFFIEKELGIEKLKIPFPEAVSVLGVSDLFNVTTSLNDSYEWTREEIADYLERLANESEVVDEPGN